MASVSRVRVVPGKLFQSGIPSTSSLAKAPIRFSPPLADLGRFLCRLRSIATHTDHFVRRLSVCPSVRLSVRLSHSQSYVLQATHAFLGMLPLFLNTQLLCGWHRSHQIFRYCMIFKWSILCHMPNMSSVDIYKRIGTSPVTPDTRI